jgi:hypothetical protein
MGAWKRVGDAALVVRCGQPPFDLPIPLCRRCVQHEGVFGFSVQCDDGMPWEKLAGWCPNRKVGVTTLGEIRGLGTMSLSPVVGATMRRSWSRLAGTMTRRGT